MSEQMEPTYEVQHGTLQRLINYLATQPYGDVFQLIAELQQIRPIMPEAPAEEEPAPPKKGRPRKKAAKKESETEEE